ncbi:MAG: ATP-binding protein, partial [Oleiharenicola lentus]
LRDGTDLLTRCNSELIELGGKRCILTLAEDISEEQRAEEERALLEAQLRQSQKLEALGTLAGGIAHDFNNILTAIVVNQELAMMDLEHPAELRERLGEISRASNRAKDLVRQILAFSRQQSEQVRAHQRLMPVVQEAMALVRASLPATIEIDQSLDAEAPPVLADATQVHQIVMNLCTNAAHAMRDRPGKLTVRLAARTLDEAQARTLPGLHPGAYARLTITDTGHGMTKAVLARIFEPFFTTKGPGEGTGLGLAVVHGIMRDHGGGIFVDSTPDVGTQFDLFFPAAPVTETGAPVVEAGIVFGHGESVLLVDDEP